MQIPNDPRTHHDAHGRTFGPATLATGHVGRTIALMTRAALGPLRPDGATPSSPPASAPYRRRPPHPRRLKPSALEGAFPSPKWSLPKCPSQVPTPKQMSFSVLDGRKSGHPSALGLTLRLNPAEVPEAVQLLAIGPHQPLAGGICFPPRRGRSHPRKHARPGPEGFRQPPRRVWKLNVAKVAVLPTSLSKSRQRQNFRKMKAEAKAKPSPRPLAKPPPCGAAHG